MNVYYRDEQVTLLLGDALEQLRALPESSVDCCVTSPPYFGLRDYGMAGQYGIEDSPAVYVETMREVFAEVRRVLADDGTLWLNLGDSYSYPPGSAGRQGSGQRAGRTFTAEALPGTRALPPKNLMMIPARVAIALQDDGWILRNDIIWCLAGSTRLYARTQKGDGPHNLRDLAQLDPATVQLWDGTKWVAVTAWTKTRHASALRLTLRNGQEITSTADHLWPTQRGVIKAADLVVGDVVATTHLPEPAEPSQPSALDDADIGWLVGTYLADGSHGTGSCIQIASHVDDTGRFARLRRIAASLDGTCRIHVTGGNSASANIHGRIAGAIIDTYIAGADAHTKHLTSRAWQRSNKFLAALLDGYLADAHYDEPNNRWRLGFCRNMLLAADLRTLAARLGASLRLVKTTSKLDGRDFPAFRGDLRMDPATRRTRDGEIVSIAPGRGGWFYDITVESEPHLFALASGVLSHNCKPNAMPESVTDRLSGRYEHVFLLTKSPKYWFDLGAVREVPSQKSIDRGRDWGNRKAAGEPARYGTAGLHGVGSSNLAPHAEGRNPGDVWDLPTQPYPEAHFAVFPSRLPQRCIKAGCKPNGTVLDPFSGSGTTGEAARMLGRHYIGIDLNPAYHDLAIKRFAQGVLDFEEAS